jgi:tRNA pseudouridine32 synthase/23S rRNA pseudouridine746 synthase/23S rRNA pseudouridine1911/1915/1917 synthase
MYKIIEESELLEFLYKNINKSKNTIKHLLTNGNISVNDKIITKYNYLLKKGDIVSIKNKIDDIDIIYEDKDLIVVNKPCNLLTVSTSKEKEKTLYHMVSNYIKKANKNNKIFVVHRLDKDTSGIVVFSKSEKLKKLLQENWNELVILREYVAIVEGITKEYGTIKSYLKEKDTFVYNTNKKEGKLAITNYRKIKSNDKYTLLDIDIETGRKNQIRVQMKDIGHIIIGDKKYGSKDNSIKRMALHANKLKFINPINNKLMAFETDIPNSFKKLIK